MASHLDRTVYLNGAYLAGRDATVSIFDRGLLFADAVYEGLGVLRGRVTDVDMHLGRLGASMAKLEMPNPHTDAEFKAIFARLIEANAVDEGFIYLHVTRGAAEREYVYTGHERPTVFAFTQSHGEPVAQAEPAGITMRSHPDLRWKRRDIKTSNLLGQVIAKTAADRAGAHEALMIDEAGYVTEGGATSFFIVVDQTIIARPVSQDILHGITRQTMLRVAEETGRAVARRKVTLAEALAADEAFITGSSTYVEPVTEIDGQKIGNGVPGPFTLALRRAYLEAI